MITLKEVLTIHSIAIEKFGGSDGLRDKGLLESAIARPFSTFESQDLHPSPIDKAAAIIDSIVKNHPFNDGNKRTGYILMRLFLLRANLDINATEQQKYELVISIASGKIEIEEIKEWINRFCIAI